MTTIGSDKLLEHIPAACYCCDRDGRLIAWNRACEAMYGYPPEEMIQRVVWERIAPTELHHQFKTYMGNALRGGTVEAVEWDNLRHDGSRRIIRSSISPLRSPDSAEGDIVGSIVVNVDVTAERSSAEQAEQELQRLQRTCLFLQQQRARIKQELTRLKKAAVTDGLTGMKNRWAFRERLNVEYERARRYESLFSLLFLDIDGFRKFNDAHGQAAGDQILIEVAQILRAQVRAVDFAGRYGGEEFVLLLPDTDRSGAVALSERIRSRIRALSIAPHQIVSASMGAITFQGTGEEQLNKGSLIGLADCALYHAKSSGRDSMTHCNDLSSEERQRLLGIFTPRKF